MLCILSILACCGVDCILKGECGTCSRLRKYHGSKYARRPNAQMEFIRTEILKIIKVQPMSNYQIWHYLNYDRPGAKIVVSQRTVDTICRQNRDIRVKQPVHVKQKLGSNADPRVLTERDSTDNAYSDDETKLIAYSSDDRTIGNNTKVTRSEHEFHRGEKKNCGELGIDERVSRKKRYTRVKSKSRPLTKEEILLLWELRKRRNQVENEKRLKRSDNHGMDR